MSTQIEQAKATATRRDQARLDLFTNAYNGFGGTKDPMYRIAFSSGTILDRATLEDMFRYNWIARRICEVIPQDATRQWIDLKTDDQAMVTDIMGRMDTLEAQTKFEEALTLSRLYGGSVIVLGALDGQQPDKPLKEDNVTELKFLNVMDRWQLSIESTYSDPLSQNFGQPEIYSLQPLSFGMAPRQGQRIHESRLLRFDGVYLPEISRIINSGWYDPVLQPIDEELKRYGTSIQSGAILMQDFVTKVLKIPNLTDLLAAGKDSALQARIQYAISYTSSLGIALLDGGTGEEFSKIQTPIAGLVDLLNVYIEMISAAAGIPRARLFGQSLGVLAGATETTRTYYDMVKAYQNKHMRRQIEKLIRIMFKAKNSITGGKEPKEWSFDFCPLWQPTEKEQAETRKLVADTDQIYIGNQVLLPEEIAKSRFGSDGYSMETTIDWPEREKYEKMIQEEQVKQAALLKAQGVQMTKSEVEGVGTKEQSQGNGEQEELPSEMKIKKL